jgi:hypothetical protein
LKDPQWWSAPNQSVKREREQQIQYPDYQAAQEDRGEGTRAAEGSAFTCDVVRCHESLLLANRTGARARLVLKAESSWGIDFGFADGEYGFLISHSQDQWSVPSKANCCFIVAQFN